MNLVEKKLQVFLPNAKEWLYVAGFVAYSVNTCSSRYEAMSNDYLDILAVKFPSMTFRSI